MDIEKKWQERWANSDIYKTNFKDKKKKPYYGLVMFPYPSGDKLHLGHWYNFAIADSYFRYIKMQGYNVLQPMGFDSFGLPAENYAIKKGVHPMDSIAENVEVMSRQIQDMGAMYNIDKNVITSTPDYYKWTQWLFLQMYKNDLAYQKEEPVNFCPNCMTVLANEQVQGGECDRCGTEVTKKKLKQWFWKLSDYAEKLLDYEGLDWPEKTIKMQENWISKSEGAEIDFRISDKGDLDGEILTAYTTRPDTLYSVTFICISPEHPMLEDLIKDTKYEDNVKKVCDDINKQTLIERTSEGGDDKLGAFTGKYVINPVTEEKIPVYVANFVLNYGTGVVMACAHDQRDFEFAKKYDISLRFVISEDGSKIDPKDFEGAYTADGVLFDSEGFSGMHNREAIHKITEYLEGRGLGRGAINYKLRDWLISRQRYWGAPIPVVHCPDCGVVPVPEENLPIELPKDVDFKPNKEGKSPLAMVEDWINCDCPKCGKAAKREADTMDTFVCSSWYYLRYPNSDLADAAFDQDTAKYWLPVNMYVGGPEHACMHLIYARFVTKVLHDLGHVPFKEPFQTLRHQGMITKNGSKMSKSKGNTVSPDEFVKKYGSDVLRMYLMFLGPYSEGADWSDAGITGIARFRDKFMRLVKLDQKVEDTNMMLRNLHKLIKKLTEDIEKLHFNTAIAAFMEFVNFSLKNGIDNRSLKTIIQLIAPFAPHLAEESWEIIGEDFSVFNTIWPRFDKKLVVETSVKIGVQVNGKVRGEIEIAADASQEDAVKAAKEIENIRHYLDQGELVKTIYVPSKILGFVLKSTS